MAVSVTRRAAIAATLVAVAAVGLVAGCSKSFDSKSSSADRAASAPGLAGEAHSSAAAAAGGAVAAPDVDAKAGSSSIVSQINLHSTALIKTAELTVVVKDVTVAADKAVQYAVDAGGGDSGEVQSLGSAATATTDLTLQVPPDQLDSLLGQLERLGTERTLQITSQDVTGQVADVNSRVASAEASIARLQDLFSKATSVSDIVALENDLEQREADLESLQAQQRALSAQTSFATVTLHLVTPSAPVVVHHHSTKGFAHGLSRGWNSFTSSLTWTLTAVGAALPFLVLLALATAVFAWVRRRGAAARPSARPLAAGADSAPGIVE